MALVFEKGDFNSPARRRRRLWPVTTAPESSYLQTRFQNLERERERNCLERGRERVKMKKPDATLFYRQRRTGPVHLNWTGSLWFISLLSLPFDLYLVLIIRL